MRFERMLSGAVRALETDRAALWTLLGISFSYGVFHAAGPGHGKAVVASYMFANERSLKRGLIISFLAALLQGVVAVTIVGVLALALSATAQQMRATANIVELASYAGVAALGAWLVWRKGRGLARAVAGDAGHDHGHHHGHAQSHAHHGHQDHAHHHHAHHHHAHHDHAHHDHAHHAHAAAALAPAPVAHVHGPDCGHFHAPSPATLGEGFSWKGAVGTIFAAGARPCSGAILVLVFALAQGVFAAGVAATFAMALGTALTTGALAAIAVLAKGLATRFLGEDTGRGLIIVRALELLAALVVLFLGASLLLAAVLGG
jgi:nickel/cobalt exporter